MKELEENNLAGDEVPAGVWCTREKPPSLLKIKEKSIQYKYLLMNFYSFIFMNFCLKTLVRV